MNHALMIAYQSLKSRRVAILTLQHQICVGVGHEAFFYPVRQLSKRNPLNYF